MKRMRGRGHRGGSGGGGGGGSGGMRHHSSGGSGVPLNRNHVFDSSGPDLRLRGTAQQLFEKYLQLGRDATGSGDRVMAESYFQHAEHYFRIINAMNQAAQQQQGGGQQGHQQGNQQGSYQQRRQYQQEGESEQSGEGGESNDGPHEEAQVIKPVVAAEPPQSGAREIPIAAAPPEQQ